MRRGAEPTIRSLVGLMVVLGVAAPALAPAYAGVGATGSSSVQTVSTGSWAAVATTSSTAPFSRAALTLAFDKHGSLPPAPRYFWVRNVGTLPLLSATYSLAASPAASTVIEECSTTWNETTGTCPGGTVSSIVSSTTTPATSGTAPRAAGSSVRLRARITERVNKATDVTIGVSLARAQARTAIISSG